MNIKKCGSSSRISLLLSPPRCMHLSRYKSHVCIVFAICARKNPEVPDPRAWHQILWEPQGLSGQIGHVHNLFWKDAPHTVALHASTKLGEGTFL